MTVLDKLLDVEIMNIEELLKSCFCNDEYERFSILHKLSKEYKDCEDIEIREKKSESEFVL